MKTPISILVILLSSSQVNAQGRCPNDDGTFQIEAGDFVQVILPYAQCLVNAEQRYGYNDGPFAVQLCRPVRAQMLSVVADEDREELERLAQRLDREFVWGRWCDTDSGPELPGNVNIRPDWPQAGARRHD